MSDLQCAVTVLVLPAGADVDVDAVRRERPVRVLTANGTQTGLARALDVPTRPLPDAGTPAGPGHDPGDGGHDQADDGGAFAVGRVTEILADLADEYRGECVVLVLPERVVTALSDQVLPVGAGATGALVRVDADGHRWSPWPSAAPE